MVDSLLEYSLQAAANSKIWKYQRRTLERLPPDVANDLLDRLLKKRKKRLFLTCSEFELFGSCVTEVCLDLDAERSGTEWLHALGGFRCLIVLKILNFDKFNGKHVHLLRPLAQKLVSIGVKLNGPAAGLALEELLPLLSNLKNIELKDGDPNLVCRIGQTLAKTMPSQIKSLSFKRCNLQDSQCLWLCDLCNLTSLDLSGSFITDLTIDCLEHNTNLQQLDVSWTNVKLIPSIQSLKHLRMCDIDLSSSSTPNAGYGLCTLNMGGSDARKGIAQINEALRTSAKSLEHVNFNCLVSYHQPELQVLRNCKSLWLSHIETNGQLLQIIGMSSLETLSITWAEVSESGMECIGSLVNLKGLDLSHCKLHCSFLRHISKLQMLERLLLMGTPVDACTGVACYAQDHCETNCLDNSSVGLNILPRLELLNLSRIRHPLKKGLGNHFGTVRTLSLGCDDLPLQDLEVLQEFDNLQYLILKASSVGENEFMQLTCCSRLLEIAIWSKDPLVPKWMGENRVDGGLGKLHKSIPSLRVVCWNKTCVLSTVTTEPRWSHSRYDERRRFSKGELLKIQETVRNQQATMNGLLLGNLLRLNHPILASSD